MEIIFKFEFLLPFHFSEHPQKDPNKKALERFMAAGGDEIAVSTLEAIKEEDEVHQEPTGQDKQEGHHKSSTTLASGASCKSAPEKSSFDRLFGEDLMNTVTK